MPINPTIRLYCLVAAFLVCPLSANCWGAPVTVVFPHPAVDTVITNYAEQGFQFSAARLEYTADYRDTSPSTDGTLRIMGVSNDNILRIGQANGRAFDLLQIDLQTSAYYATGTTLLTGTETFTGFLSGGGTVQQTFNITQNWQTFSFPVTFANLLYVTAPQTVTGGFSIDNVVINPFAVPEPGAATILVFAGALLAVVLWRRMATEQG